MKTGTNFKDRVYALTAKIPKGKVTTYGTLAALAGRPGAARAVGNAMRTNTDTKTVPCHRVVGASGALTGYAYGNGIATKKAKLKREGVAFKGDAVDLTISGWGL
jgi:methylated-DNA-[protein]-cysteine S-methyltransferase